MRQGESMNTPWGFYSPHGTRHYRGESIRYGLGGGESMNTPWGFYPPHGTRHYFTEERVYATDEGGESMNTLRCGVKV